MDFNYADYFGATPATGYETLLYDCMNGDPTLFQRADMVEAGWEVVAPMLEAWTDGDGLAFYEAGVLGPAEADALIARDGREWRERPEPDTLRVIVAAPPLFDAASGHHRRRSPPRSTRAAPAGRALRRPHAPRGLRRLGRGRRRGLLAAGRVVFGDERVVPPEDPHSNYRMTRAALFDRVPLPSPQVHRIEGERARRPRRRCLRRGPHERSRSRRPHAVSMSCCSASARRPHRVVVPARAALSVADRSGRRGDRPIGADVSRHADLPVLNAARAVVVLVSGADKAGAVARAFDDAVPVADCPVRGVRPAGPHVAPRCRRGVETGRGPVPLI